MRLRLLTEAADAARVLPALGTLDVSVTTADLEAPVADEPPDAVLVDVTREVPPAVEACRRLGGAGRRPVLLVTTPAVLAAVNRSWGFDDWVDRDASPAEVRARLRVAMWRSEREEDRLRVGAIEIDEAGYAVRARGESLDLTPTEFDVLRALVASAGRVLSRETLLERAWDQHGHYGGSRKVDVYVRRLRAKLGPELEAMIVTVRGVGYKLVPLGEARAGQSPSVSAAD